MAESLPSKQISVADVPEVEQFSGNFYYNFFTPDEKVNSNGTVPRSLLERSGERFDSNFVDSVEFNRSVPRYNEFQWKTVVVGNKPEFINISIEKNYKKLHYEDDFSLNDYTLLTIQDTNVDQKMAFFIRKAVQNLAQFSKNGKRSMQENAKILNQNTDSDITPEFLDIGLNPQSTGTKFFDLNGVELKSSLVESLKNVKTQISLNNKIISDIIQTTAYDEANSPFSDELSEFTAKAKNIQEIAKKTRDSAQLSASDYDFEINDYIVQRTIDSDKYDSILQTIGYVIEKEEINVDGSVNSLPPIFIENPLVATTVDVRLKYGATYNYRIRTVAYVEIQAVEETLGTIAAIGFLIASKTSPAVTIVCNENLAPPPPADFDQRWDYKLNRLRLNWSFPVNTQQDIKKFQVFRRKTVEEPFQLIKMYNFDDSVVQTQDNEIPYPELVEIVKSPILTFTDNEFTKNSKYIYAVCSLDAHGFTSGYSTQFEISFDKSRNKLQKTLISISGAPKAYPNIYLNRDTFIDSIKDEWHEKLKIYFNPEYLRVYDNDSNDLKLLKAGKADKYVFQLINLDLQKQESIEIKIKDLTKDQRLSINNKKVYPIDPGTIESTPPQDRQTDTSGRWTATTGNSFKIIS